MSKVAIARVIVYFGAVFGVTRFAEEETRFLPRQLFRSSF